MNDSAAPSEIGTDPVARAAALGVSREAIELLAASEVVDLHVDSFIWTRLLGYDPLRRHGAGVFGARFYSQVDLPRLREAGVGSAVWAITTNPWRTAAGRGRALAHNLARFEASLRAAPDRWRLVTTASEHAAARAAGLHAVFLGIQGGHALDDCDEGQAALDDGRLVLVTLVHLSTSSVGATSSPLRLGADRGLTRHGHELVERLNAARVFVDLAHISRAGFFDVLQTHDRSQPLLVSHTGVSGVTPLWRNIDDEQLRAVADTGGVVGVIFHSAYLGDRYLGSGRVSRIAEHLVHIVRTVGAEHAALGSDWDGAIITPRDMPTCLELPRLVQALLDAGVDSDDVSKILGRSFLGALRRLRG